MAFTCSRSFLPVQNSYGSFGIFVASFKFLLLILYGVGLFLPVPDGSGSFSPDLWFFFSSSGLILMLLDCYGKV